MSYVDCMIAAVPTAKKQEYLEHAKFAGEVFKNHGALKLIEHWGDDVPEGEVTSFPKAVQCKPDETVVFSWISWRSKEARDAGMEGVMSDPVMEEHPMPFDGKRMIFGGFDIILEI